MLMEITRPPELQVLADQIPAASPRRRTPGLRAHMACGNDALSRDQLTPRFPFGADGTENGKGYKRSEAGNRRIAIYLKDDLSYPGHLFDYVVQAVAVDRYHNPRAFAALEKWIAHANIAPGTPLFRRIHPRGGIGGRITADGVCRAIKAAIKRYYLTTGTAEGCRARGKPFLRALRPRCRHRPLFARGHRRGCRR